MVPLDVLMVRNSKTIIGLQPNLLTTDQAGTGEYTTGFVGGGASGSDKKVGVVGLTFFDLRRRGKVGKLSMVGTSGSKFPAISKFYSLTKCVSREEKPYTQLVDQDFASEARF